MKELKTIISENIIALRKSSGLTQAEMADKLNYTDKAISKWERGLSTPDIEGLKNIADLFGVSLDYLTSEQDKEPVLASSIDRDSHMLKRKHIYICLMSIVLVWLIAIVIFVTLNLALNRNFFYICLPFLYAVPTSLIIWLVYNAVWFNTRRNYTIISLLMWSSVAILTIHMSVVFGYFIPWFLLLCIPGQIIIFLWSRLNIQKDY